MKIYLFVVFLFCGIQGTAYYDELKPRDWWRKQAFETLRDDLAQTGSDYKIEIITRKSKSSYAPPFKIVRPEVWKFNGLGTDWTFTLRRSSFLIFYLNSYLNDQKLSFPAAVLLTALSELQTPPYELEPIMECDPETWKANRKHYIELLRRKCRISSRYVWLQYHYELFLEQLTKESRNKFFSQEEIFQGRVGWKIRMWYLWQYETDFMRKRSLDYHFSMLMSRSPKFLKNLVPDLYKVCRSYITCVPNVTRRDTFENWLDLIMLAQPQRRPTEINLFLEHLETLNFEPEYADIAQGLFRVFGYSFDDNNAEYTINPIGWETLEYVIRHPAAQTARGIAILLRGKNADAIRKLMQEYHQEATWNELLQPWHELMSRKPTDQPFAETFPLGVFDPERPAGDDAPQPEAPRPAWLDNPELKPSLTGFPAKKK